MRRVGRSVLLCVLFIVESSHRLPAQGGYAGPILAGVSNHGQNEREPYVTAGDRTYLIGTQDGNFPDMGDHVPGEMGGLWLHPIKLIDGFRATVRDIATNQEIALSETAEFVSHPYGSRFRYGSVLDGVRSSAFNSARTARTG